MTYRSVATFWSVSHTRAWLSKVIRAENIFLIYALIFGIAFMIVTAPFQSPDEYMHFGRSYMISKGQVFATRGLIPKTLSGLMYSTRNLVGRPEEKIRPETVLKFFQIPLNKTDETNTAFPFVMQYSALPFLPQAVGCLVGRLLSLPPAAIYYLARLFNFGFWVTISYITLRVTPVYKWVFLALMLTPMSLFQSISTSADPFSNALSFLTFAICLYLASEQSGPMTRRKEMLLVALGILLAFTKPPYALLVGLFLMIPLRKYQSTKHFLVFSTVLFFVTLIAFIIGVSIGTKVDYATIRSSVNARPVEQAIFILTHPKSDLVILYNTFLMFYHPVWLSFIGNLGWLDTLLKNWIYQTYLVFLALVCLFDNQKDVRIGVWKKAVALVSVTATLLAISAALYISWNQYQSSVVWGIHGRYLIPVMPAVALLFYNNHLKWNKISAALVLIYVPAVLASAVQTLLLRYYQF